MSLWANDILRKLVLLLCLGNCSTILSCCRGDSSDLEDGVDPICLPQSVSACPSVMKAVHVHGSCCAAEDVWKKSGRRGEPDTCSRADGTGRRRRATCRSSLLETLVTIL
jgi:hypothetical protein